MSRIGRQPIEIPSGVTLQNEGGNLTVFGPKGVMHLFLHPSMTVDQEGTILRVQPKGSLATKALHGTMRKLIANAVVGVTTGWSKSLELVGVGYRAVVNGPELTLTIGFSHPVKIQAPEGITFVVSGNTITISGFDRQRVGETAATVRRIRPPEPYKGKGIRYSDERIRRKAGKAAKAAGAAGGAK